MESLAFTRDGDEREWAFGELNAKVGLNDATDLQVVLPVYTHAEGGDEGFGDMQLRLKRNLWGNDGGATAFGLMPFVKIPTANDGLGNDKFEGGLIVPFTFDAPAGWSCATMAEFDLNADEDGSGYHLGTVVSVSLSHDLTECTGVFFELAGIAGGAEPSAREAYFNSGLTWLVSSAWQIDAGLRIGLTSDSTDFSPFTGVSVKF